MLDLSLLLAMTHLESSRGHMPGTVNFEMAFAEYTK